MSSQPTMQRTTGRGLSIQCLVLSLICAVSVLGNRTTAADDQDDPQPVFQAGAATANITPALGADIVGGHSGEGPELSVGFALSGTVHEDDVWHKHRIAIDDALR